MDSWCPEKILTRTFQKGLRDFKKHVSFGRCWGKFIFSFLPKAAC